MALVDSCCLDAIDSTLFQPTFAINTKLKYLLCRGVGMLWQSSGCLVNNRAETLRSELCHNFGECNLVLPIAHSGKFYN